MNRTGLFVALAIVAIAGLVFGLYPDLDLALARWFIDLGTSTLAMPRLLDVLRNVSMWLIWAMLAPAGVALVLKLVLPHRRLIVSGRAILLLTLTMALGPGLLVNGMLKEHWGRPRPAQVTALGGNEAFVPWWSPRGTCPTNCSFVSGDVSAGFWTLAPAALTPPPWRPAAYAVAITFGSGIAVLRMLRGRHFASDVIFAGVFTFLIIWVVYNALYRWPATRLLDAAIEQWLERLARPRRWFARTAPRSIDRPEAG